MMNMKFFVLVLGFASIIYAEQPKPLQFISVDDHQPRSIDIGENVLLTCKSYKDKFTTPVVWEKENGMLPEKSHQQSNGNLAIQNIQPEDGGVYRCRLEDSQTFKNIELLLNNRNPSRRSKSNPFEMLPTPSPPCRASQSKSISIQPTTFSSQVGDILVLACHNAINRNAPIMWRKIDSQLPPYVIIRNGILIIKSVSVKDSGRYACESFEDNDVISDVANVYIVSNQIGITEIPPSGFTSEDVLAPRFLPISTEKVAQSSNIANTWSPPQVKISPNFSKLTLSEGDTLVFICTASGFPTPRTQWKSFGRLLAQSTHGNATYFKSNVSISDEGEYMCTAVNEAGQSEESIKVFVRSRKIDIETTEVSINTPVSTYFGGFLPRSRSTSSPSPPIITISPNSSEITVYSGNQLDLNCLADGFPTPEVKWEKTDGSFLESISIARNINVIKKANVRVSDSGFYVCSASNNFGPRYKSIKVVVRPNSLRQYKISAGGRARISCEIENANRNPTWKRQDKRPLPRNSYLSGNDLVIDQVQKDSAGIYECSLIDQYGDSSVLASELIVFENIATTPTIGNEPLVLSRPPLITILPNSSNITLYQGDQINLICSADGFPLPRVQWKKYGHGVVPKTLSSAALHKSSVKFEDEGAYVCFASNQAGNTEKRINLIVRPNPPLQYKVSRGDRAKISCEIDNTAGIRLFWRRQDGLALPRSSHLSGGNLTIDEVQNDAAGIYECVMHGRNGEQPIVTADVIIVDPLQISLSPQSPLNVRYGEKVRIYCQVSGDKPINIEWHYEDNRPLPNNVQVTKNYLQFDQIAMGNSGRYHCTASNLHGRTTKTAEITVMYNERNCGENEFQCRDFSCIPMYFRCDKTKNCPNGEDEVNCPSQAECSPQEFKCRNGDCIDRMKLCDENYDCAEGEDEKICLSSTRKPKTTRNPNRNHRPTFTPYSWGRQYY